VCLYLLTPNSLSNAKRSRSNDDDDNNNNNNNNNNAKTNSSINSNAKPLNLSLCNVSDKVHIGEKHLETHKTKNF
jgi:hypothetical protein